MLFRRYTTATPNPFDVGVYAPPFRSLREVARSMRACGSFASGTPEHPLRGTYEDVRLDGGVLRWHVVFAYQRGVLLRATARLSVEDRRLVYVIVGGRTYPGDTAADAIALTVAAA